MNYTAFMVDMVNSKKISKKDREEVQFFIKQSLDILNKIFKPSLIFDIIFSAGILVYILMYIICLSPTAVFIKKVFVFFSIQDDTYIYRKEELISSGYLIGILERIIILTLGLNAQLGAIGFVLAAKSLARFKQLEDKSFAEKYLQENFKSPVLINVLLFQTILQVHIF